MSHDTTETCKTACLADSDMLSNQADSVDSDPHHPNTEVMGCSKDGDTQNGQINSGDREEHDPNTEDLGFSAGGDMQSDQTNASDSKVRHSNTETLSCSADGELHNDQMDVGGNKAHYSHTEDLRRQSKNKSQLSLNIQQLSGTAQESSMNNTGESHNVAEKPSTIMSNTEIEKLPSPSFDHSLSGNLFCLFALSIYLFLYIFNRYLGRTNKNILCTKISNISQISCLERKATRQRKIKAY